MKCLKAYFSDDGEMLYSTWEHEKIEEDPKEKQPDQMEDEPYDPEDEIWNIEPGEFIPFRHGKKHIPAYYKPVRTSELISEYTDPFEIATAYDLDGYRMLIIKYALRAGRKPGEPFEKDIHKILECAQRLLDDYKREKIVTF